MKRLFAPWREVYAQSKGREKAKDAREEECLFCALAHDKKVDSNEYVLTRGKNNYVLLNRYPYNAGHLLVVPTRHVKVLDELSPPERAELIEQVSTASSNLRTTLHADGINIGMNIGRAAGAGIPSHLHVHILPRWDGDTNFMPSLAETKIISFDLNDIYQKLKPLF